MRRLEPCPIGHILWIIIMFETHAQTLLPGSDLNANPGCCVWSYVVLPDDLPWFQITWCYRPRASNECTSAEKRLVGYVPTLLGHLNSDDEEHFVTEVLLVSPSWLNKTNMTMMQQLSKLISYIPFEGSVPLLAYEVVGGARYPSELKWEDLDSVELLFDRCQLAN